MHHYRDYTYHEVNTIVVVVVVVVVVVGQTVWPISSNQLLAKQLIASQQPVPSQLLFHSFTTFRERGKAGYYRTYAIIRLLTTVHMETSILPHLYDNPTLTHRPLGPQYYHTYTITSRL